MYEHRGQPLAPVSVFWRRQARHAGIALLILLPSLVAGVLGYRLLEGMAWVDALVNAAMILGGMGPVNELHTDAAKVFAAIYALYSGVVFLVVVAIVVAPAAHRMLHHFHLESQQAPRKKPAP